MGLLAGVAFWNQSVFCLFSFYRDIKIKPKKNPIKLKEEFDVTDRTIGFWYQDPQDALYKDVELNFEAGKMYAILGASGSGKTTFLSLISGLDAPKKERYTIKIVH